MLDAALKVIRETNVASEPKALVTFLCGLSLTIVCVGLEAGPLSQWLYDGQPRCKPIQHLPDPMIAKQPSTTLN